MLSLLIVAFDLNYEPALPPEGSGLFGFVEALLLEKADPFLPDFLAWTTLEIFCAKACLFLTMLDALLLTINTTLFKINFWRA